MDFLADDVAAHKKQSIVSSTHGTSQPNLKPFDKKASIQTEFYNYGPFRIQQIINQYTNPICQFGILQT